MAQQKATPTKGWWEFFDWQVELCGICANSGVIDTRGMGIRSPAGCEVGIVAHCICPNGRAKKKANFPLPAKREVS